MDQEVAKTLGELELKLQELERELTTVGHSDTPAEPLHAPGKLIDEAVERDDDRDGDGVTDAEPSIEEQAVGDGDGFGGPAVFGGEELPAQAGATVERDWTVEARETAYGEIPTPPTPPPSPLLGKPLQPPPLTTPGPPSPATPPAPPAAAAPPGTPPASIPPGIHPPSSPPGSRQPSRHPPDPRYPAAVEENQSIDLAELARFRDKLASTMDALIDEYSRLLSVEPPSRSRPDA